MRRMHHVFSAVVLTALFSSCGTRSSKNTNQPSNAADKNGQAEAKASSKDPTNDGTGGAPSLNGRWLKPCYQDPNSEGSYEGIYEISDTEVVATHRAYSDLNCKTKLYESKFTSSYRLGGTSKSVPDAVEIDETLTKSTTTFFDQAIADQANAEQKQLPSAPCNQIVFKINTETDTTICEKPDKTQYSIVKISAAELVFGACSDGESSCTSVELRATKLGELRLKRAQ